MALGWQEVIGTRLMRHHLLEPAPADDLVRVTSAICGAHAQVGASAELMLGVRVRDITRQQVREALWRKRTLVKTVGLRGTLHLLPAEEVPLWMAANRLRLPAEERRIARQLGVEVAALRSVVDAIGEVVGPEPMTRPDFERELEARVGGWSIGTNQGWMGSYRNWPVAMGLAAARGLVCYGPGEGGRSTFVRLADWSGWREADPWEGGKFALRRFLHAYGPSTASEFARWFAHDPAIARQLFAELGDELAEVDVEDGRRWRLRSDAESAAEPAPEAVHLLPHFDVYVVGFHPRSELMPRGSRVAQVSPGTAAPFAVLLKGGRVAGVWERRPKGKKLLVRVDAHGPLNRRQRAAVEGQAHRVAEVLERELELEFGEVVLNPHA